MVLALVLLFVVLPIVELYVLIQVGQLIGVLPAILLLLAVSIAGGWLVRREGARAWRAFRDATGEGRIPGREVADGALVLLGGALLLTPGFVTDVLGLLLVFRPTRAVVRAALVGWAARRAAVVTVASGGLRDRRGTQRVRSARGPATPRSPAGPGERPELPPE
jgi:UPF0716 protein FxsA